MGGKETGCSGARIWVGWSCLLGLCEKGEVETGLLLHGLDEPVESGPKE